MKIRMHALYDHFPDLNPKEGEEYINCYSDTYVEQCKAPGKNIAMLLEPKSMIAPAYSYVQEHQEYFRYIFTHDSELLALPQSRMLNWADVWTRTDIPKTKSVSLITSSKNWCPLHIARLKLADCLMESPVVDVFRGDWNNPNVKNYKPEEYLSEYKFSIIIENDIDELWFTEKILNCFSTKTVPIYVGATKIGNVFNADGIIQVDDWRNIPSIVANLDIDSEYNRRTAAIADNFERSRPWEVKWKERFFRDYGDILEGLQHE